MIFSGCGQSQAEKDFYRSLVASADQSQQDITKANSILEKVAVSSIPTVSGIDVPAALSQLQSLELTFRNDAASDIAPAPSDCSNCASASDTIKQDWVQAQSLLKQSETPLTLLISAQTVHDQELNELKGVPQPVNPQMMSEDEFLAMENAKRQAHVNATSGYTNMRAQITSDNTRNVLEKLISAEQNVVSAYDNESDSWQKLDTTLLEDAVLKLNLAESNASNAFTDLQKNLQSDLEANKGLLSDLQNGLKDFIAGLPQ